MKTDVTNKVIVNYFQLISFFHCVFEGIYSGTAKLKSTSWVDINLSIGSM